MANEPEHWSGDFRSAEERVTDGSLAATPSQRLKWLEEALEFAVRVREVVAEGAPRPRVSRTEPRDVDGNAR